ncbi:hypothetical protein [uncultured Rikenella sp.]|uniref:hypothetical protein n=1 Tax=uncultured Rikenella sp. TaxID=368003 RepID=UPI0025FC0ED7|nr:hypothetical protein [uncultured Rikenella sp.]
MRLFWNGICKYSEPKGKITDAFYTCSLATGGYCSLCEQREPEKLQSASLRDALAVSARLGWAGFSAGALIMGKNPTRAAPENPSPTNKAEITRGRPHGTTSAKVLWVPFFQERYGSSRGKKEYEKGIEILFILKQNQEQIRTFVHCK